MAQLRDNTELLHAFVNNRDPKLREQIILGFLPLVHFVLGKLKLSQSMGADYEDAASQGLIGLIEAVDKYDPSYGTQFTTYAIFRVRGRILDHLSSLDWLSRTARRRARAVQQAINQLWPVLQREPTEDELCEFLDFDQSTLKKALYDSNHSIVSLDSPLNANGEKETSYHEILPDDGQDNPAERLDEQDLLARLVSALSRLPERQRHLLSFYYYDELTFKEISALMGVSESRVCQLHARAVVALRSALSHQGVTPAAEQRYIHLRPFSERELASTISRNGHK